MKTNRIKNKEACAGYYKCTRTDIIPKKKIALITSLITKLGSNVLSCGVDHLRDSTKKHVYRKLEFEFGDSVNMFLYDKGKLMIIADKVLNTRSCLQKENLHG